VHERLQAAEAALAKAEQDVTELRKLDSFAAMSLDEYRARLAIITAAKG
jgi:Tfp pilus assembly protein PilX